MSADIVSMGAAGVASSMLPDALGRSVIPLTPIPLEVPLLGEDAERLRLAFMRWQCRVRQMAMREREGRPNDGMLPALRLDESPEVMGHVITLICKRGTWSQTAELKHLAQQSHDPAQQRAKAITLLSERWYQQAREFSDTLTATFAPASTGAEAILAAASCELDFDAFNQRYTLKVRPIELDKDHPLYQATWWHNRLFNPGLHPDTRILGFEPDWTRSTADPLPLGG